MAEQETQAYQYQKVADYWSNSNKSDNFSAAVYWLANPILNRQYNIRAAGGRNYINWLSFCVDMYAAKNGPAARMLSVGCGTGGLERHLANLKAFQHLDAVDIAAESIEIAKKTAAEQNLSGINYYVRNIEESGFPAAIPALFLSLQPKTKFDVFLRESFHRA
jgi:2-polyprenyl-3-methyl-5-hydroxy-6-metoxy-1,4-benzoquinol methylase